MIESVRGNGLTHVNDCSHCKAEWGLHETGLHPFGYSKRARRRGGELGELLLGTKLLRS